MTQDIHSRAVPEELAGIRLDQALARMFPEYSRSRLKEWLLSGAISVDGASRRPRDAVRGGEVVEYSAHMVSTGDLSVLPREVYADGVAERHFYLAQIHEERFEITEAAAELARAAHEETGLGRVEDKTRKNLLVTEKTPGPEDRNTRAASADNGMSSASALPPVTSGPITVTICALM